MPRTASPPAGSVVRETNMAKVLGVLAILAVLFYVGREIYRGYRDG